MGYKALYFEEVRQDIKEAKEWYRLQRIGLEKRFSIDLKTTIKRILDRPLSMPSAIKIFALPIRIFSLIQVIFI